jgi:hypothetical protein
MLKPLTALVALAFAPSALATEWMVCSDPAGEVEIRLLLGTLDVLVPAAVTLGLPERRWVTASAYGEGEPITVGQAFMNRDALLLDLLDGDVNSRIAELRLFRAEEGEAIIQAGTLRVLGAGAWAVSCGEG